MLNSSLNKKLLLLTLLTSVATLTACGKKEAQPEPASSTSVAAKVTSKSSSVTTTIASSASSEETQTEESATETSSEEVVTEESSAEEESSEAVAATSATSLDVNGLSSGDYSSVAGTWANAKGEVITVTADGEMTVQRGDGSDPFTIYMRVTGTSESGYAYGGVGSLHGESFWSHATIAIVPAGTANILGDIGERDHIEIGHGAHAANPEEQYFRQ